MTNNLFLVDSNSVWTYDELFSALNSLNAIPRIVYKENNFNLFQYIILSLIYGVEITILDSDFSEQEIEKLGLSIDGLNDKFIFNNKIELKELNFISAISTSGNWRLSLFTSGTTGFPKKVSHSFESITRMVKVDEKKRNDIWGLAYNPTHIAGLQVFFQALLNRNTIINLFSESRRRILELIEKYRITNISATPTFYRLLLPFERDFPEVKRITSGGEKFDVTLRKSISNIFPNAKILNVYASTEAGSIFAANNDVFTVKMQVEKFVKIENEELLIHKDLLGHSKSFNLVNDWYNTGDKVEVLAESPLTFRFVSRQSEIINVGGYNVNPSEVEQTINTHKSVVTSRVFGKKNSVLGNIIMAEVQVNNEISEKELRQFLSDKLQPYKIPRIFNFVDKIKLTRSGKIKRS